MLSIPLGNSSLNFGQGVLFFASLYLKIYSQAVVVRCLSRALNLSYFGAADTKKSNQVDAILKPSPIKYNICEHMHTLSPHTSTSV